MMTTQTPDYTETAAPAGTAPTTAAASGTQTLSLVSFIGAIASLALGQTIVLPVVAIVLGFVARRQEPAGRTFALWGIILGFVALFGWILAPLAALAVAGPFFLFGLF